MQRPFKKFLAGALMCLTVLGANPAGAQLVPPPPVVVTPPADTTAPTTSSVTVASVSDILATVLWTTNELASSRVEYGLTTSYGQTTSLDASLVLAHSVALTGLASSTMYHYRVKSTDATGNTAVSSDFTFTTAAALDTTGPVLTLCQSEALTSAAASVAWASSELSTSQVEYGTTTSYGSSTTMGSTLLNAHAEVLTGLAPSTTYHFRVKSSDGAGNVTTGCEGSFTTPAAADTTPPLISGVAAVSLVQTDATIVWATDEFAVSRLEYGTTTSYGHEATLGVSALLAHTATLLDLSAGTTYYYCIHATDLAGYTANSCGHSFTTPTATEPDAIYLDANPPTISVVTVVPITTTSATVNWATQEIANGEIEYGATASYGSVTPLTMDFSLTHSINISGLAADTEYHYRIRSRDEIGNVALTPDNVFRTAAHSQSAPAVVPSATISSVEVTNVTAATATLTWNTDVPSDTQITYGTNNTFGTTVVLDGEPTTAHTATLSGLIPGTTYYFQVSSKPLGVTITTTSPTEDFSTLSSPSTVTPSAPASILSLSVVEATASGVAIDWTTNIPTDGRIEYGAAFGSYVSMTPYAGALTTMHSTEVTGLTPDTIYHFRIAAHDADGHTTFTLNETFETAPLSEAYVQAPPIESGLSSSSMPAPVISSVEVDEVSMSTATIAWNTDLPTDARVEYGESAALGTMTPVREALATGHSVVLTNLTPGTNYFYRVISKTAGGAAMAVSALGDFNTLFQPVVTDPPAHIVSVTVVNVTTTSATVRWSTDELTSGQVEYGLATDYGESTPVSATAQDLHVMTLTGLTPGTTYHFRAKASDSAGNITYSQSLTFTTVPQEGQALAAPAGPMMLPASSGVGSSGSSARSALIGVTLIQGEPMDSQIDMTWRNPQLPDFAGVVIIRNAAGYPDSPQDGQVVYNGSRQTFTDTDLRNGSTYYYAVYAYDHAGRYSLPRRFSLSPVSGKTEAFFKKSPVLVRAVPEDHFVGTLKIGQKHIEIEHLQEILAADDQLYPQKLVTGYFGTLTLRALKKFQAKHGLPQTGVTDEPTRLKLHEVSMSREVLKYPQDLVLFERDLRFGQQGDDVDNLQQFLAYEGSYREAVMSGTFGTTTRDAVSRFQKKYGVNPAVGYVGYKTRHKIKTLVGL